MRLILRGLIGLIFVTSVVSCNDNDNKGSKNDLYDISGTYNVKNKDYSRVNIIEIDQFNELKDVRMRLSREGLSVEEGKYYNDVEIYHWADSAAGRVLILGDANFDFAKEENSNITKGEKVVLSICSRTLNSPRPSLSFIYCIEGSRKFNKDKFSAKLVLHVLKNGERQKKINTKIEAYTNDRWSNQYLGQWRGTVDIKNDAKQDLNIVTGDSFDYDILTRFGSYFVQPFDVNRVIEYKGERFILHPDEPAILDLEKSTQPYINFRYWSERRGERRLNFNGHFRGAGRLEGNITFYRGKGKREITLGTYVMIKR